MSADKFVADLNNFTIGAVEWRATRFATNQPKSTESAPGNSASKEASAPRGKSTRGKVKPTLIGKWDVTMIKKDGTVFVQSVFEFHPDGTFWNVTKNIRDQSFHWKEIGNGDFEYITA